MTGAKHATTVNAITMLMGKRAEAYPLYVFVYHCV